MAYDRDGILENILELLVISGTERVEVWGRHEVQKKFVFFSLFLI